MHTPLNRPSRPKTVTKFAEALQRRPRACLLARICERAVRAAVEPVDDEPDVQPHQESHPGDDREAEHQVGARQDAENRKDRPQRHAERPMRVRTLDAQHQHGRADDDEGEQRADARHLADDV